MGKSIVTRLLQISPGPVAQWVASPFADPGVASLISRLVPYFHGD